MFDALGLRLEGDHLDLSFRDAASWPRVGPAEGMPPSLWLSVGDPVSGPGVQLGAFPAAAGGPDLWLDTHYHGSDQFRALVSGKMLLQGKHMIAGQFVYQEAGKPYREGMVGESVDEMWLFAVHGDRRGARATLVRRDGTFALDESQIGEDQLDRYVSSADDPYWSGLPGGSRGVAAVATIPQENRSVYTWGTFDDNTAWRRLADDVVASAGVFGAAETGPIVLTIHSAAGRAAVPASTFQSEVICLVVRGEVKIGAQRYVPGEVRVQQAGARLDAVMSGPEGGDIVFMVADRRARPQTAEDDGPSRQWAQSVCTLYDELAPA